MRNAGCGEKRVSVLRQKTFESIYYIKIGTPFFVS